MNTHATRFLLMAGLVGLGATCVPANPPGGGGTGGTTPAGTGGRAATGTGGTTPTGSGGATPTGSGCTTPTGSVCTSPTVSGGTTPTGSGGTTPTGSGGTTPTDAGVTTASFSYNFDTTVEGFGLNTYVPTGAMPQINLAAPEASAPATVVWDGAAGSPSPGSLKFTATFTDYKQFADVVIGPAAPGLNLTGKTVRAKVMLSTGMFVPGMGATLHVGTGASYTYAGGAYTSLLPNAWTDLTLDLTAVTTAGFDPSMVVQIGIQFYSGEQGEAGAFPGPVSVVIQIDTITDGTGPVVTPALSYTFDTTTQGFGYNAYVPSDGSQNLAAPEASAPATLTWDSAEGSPAPGSLKVSATFSAYRQFVDVVIAPAVKNLTGKIIKAKVKLTSGTFGPGSGATMHAGTGASYTYGSGAYTTLMPGVWTDVTLDLSMVTATGWDPTMVVQLGIQFYSGDMPEAGGAFVGPNAVVINIDSITE